MNTKQGMKTLFGHLWDSNLTDIGYNNRNGSFTLGEEALHDVTRIWYDESDECFKVNNSNGNGSFPANDPEQVEELINYLEHLESELEY